MKQFLIAIIHVYRRFISPLFGTRCRYYPSCSQYAADALNEWGAVGGSWIALKRIVRCVPWRDGGFDPVPTRHNHDDAGISCEN